MLSLSLALLLCNGDRMTREEAWSWWEKTGAIKGVNYLPSTAGNSTEMWQASTFTPEVIERELALAQATGINAVRVFVQYIVWEDDPDGMIERFRWFLSTAADHGIKTMPVLFDDCAFGYPACKDPYLGPQGDPLPGEYSPYWTPSPGHAMIDDKVHWPKLKKYVQAFVSEFKSEENILMWDMYNEPGNGGVRGRSHELVLESIKWARNAGPSQPVTVGAYATNLEEKASQDFIDASDVVTFHTYNAPGQVRRMIDVCARAGRPVLCTESVIRRGGNTYQNLLPIFAERSVGWFSWGLVNGRTQTYLHWGSRPGSPRPAVWQHDLYTTEYEPYDQEEIDMIRSFKFMRGGERRDSP